MGEKAKAPALAKGLEIIDVVREHGSVGFNELQKLTNTNPASLSRYLHTLMEKNYLYKLPGNKYELGIRMIGLADNKSLWPRLMKRMDPLMKDINEEFKVTVLFIGFMEDKCIALKKYTDRDNLAMMARNKSFDNDLHTIWSEHVHKKKTIQDFDEMWHAIRDKLDGDYDTMKALTVETVSNGYMFFREDDRNVVRMAFPVTYMGKVVGVLGMGSFIGRIDKRINELITYVQGSLPEILVN
jgi:DNA-binding IclR family transcriptional regulator